MKHSYEQIQKEIRRRTRQYRRRQEQVTLAILGMLCLLLSGGMLPLLSRAGMGSSTVPGGYSSVLLHSGASAYVVIGIAAFVAGCTITALCLYLKNGSAGTGMNDPAFRLCPRTVPQPVCFRMPAHRFPHVVYPSASGRSHSSESAS